MSRVSCGYCGKFISYKDMEDPNMVFVQVVYDQFVEPVGEDAYHIECDILSCLPKEKRVALRSIRRSKLGKQIL